MNNIDLERLIQHITDLVVLELVKQGQVKLTITEPNGSSPSARHTIQSAVQSIVAPRTTNIYTDGSEICGTLSGTTSGSFHKVTETTQSAVPTCGTQTSGHIGNATTKRPVITEALAKQLVTTGQAVPDNAIITPLAKDILRKQGGTR